MQVRTEFQVFHYDELSYTNIVTVMGLLSILNGIIDEFEDALRRNRESLLSNFNNNSLENDSRLTTFQRLLLLVIIYLALS